MFIILKVEETLCPKPPNDLLEINQYFMNTNES